MKLCVMSLNVGLALVSSFALVVVKKWLKRPVGLDPQEVSVHSCRVAQ